MKRKSNAAVVKTMKATIKKTTYLQAVYAIERKLQEMKVANTPSNDRSAHLALFGYDGSNARLSDALQAPSRQAKVLSARTAQQLALF